MHTRNGNSCQRTTRNERVFILAYLIPLRKVGIKIVLSVEFRVIGQCPAERDADPKNVPYRFPIDDGEGPRMREAYWAYVRVWFLLIRIVLGITEHLRPGLQFSVDLETDSGNILAHKGTLPSDANLRKEARGKMCYIP